MPLVFSAAAAGVRHTAAKKNNAKTRADLQNQLIFLKAFQRYDVNGDGHLVAHELSKLLQDMDGGKAPTELQVNFIMKQALKTGTHKQSGDVVYLLQDEIGAAINCWSCYVELFTDEGADLAAIFQQIDPEAKGDLKRDELKELLEALEGADLSETEVDWVFQEAKLIGDGHETSQAELKLAIAIWFQTRNGEKRKASKDSKGSRGRKGHPHSPHHSPHAQPKAKKDSESSLICALL